jgi:hypothetical protein
MSEILNTPKGAKVDEETAKKEWQAHYNRKNSTCHCFNKTHS